MMNDLTSDLHSLFRPIDCLYHGKSQPSQTIRLSLQHTHDDIYLLLHPMDGSKEQKMMITNITDCYQGRQTQILLSQVSSSHESRCLSLVSAHTAHQWDLECDDTSQQQTLITTLTHVFQTYGRDVTIHPIMIQVDENNNNDDDDNNEIEKTIISPINGLPPLDTPTSTSTSTSIPSPTIQSPTSDTYELQIECRHLPQLNDIHIDPLVCLFRHDSIQHTFHFIDQTERAVNTTDPTFLKRVRVTWTKQEQPQIIRLTVYHATEQIIHQQDRIGTVDVVLDDLVSPCGVQFVYKLMTQSEGDPPVAPDKTPPTIHIRAERRQHISRSRAGSVVNPMSPSHHGHRLSTMIIPATTLSTPTPSISTSTITPPTPTTPEIRCLLHSVTSSLSPASTIPSFPKPIPIYLYLRDGLVHWSSTSAASTIISPRRGSQTSNIDGNIPIALITSVYEGREGFPFRIPKLTSTSHYFSIISTRNNSIHLETHDRHQRDEWMLHLMSTLKSIRKRVTYHQQIRYDDENDEEEEEEEEHEEHGEEEEIEEHGEEDESNNNNITPTKPITTPLSILTSTSQHSRRHSQTAEMSVIAEDDSEEIEISASKRSLNIIPTLHTTQSSPTSPTSHTPTNNIQHQRKMSMPTTLSPTSTTSTTSNGSYFTPLRARAASSNDVSRAVEPFLTVNNVAGGHGDGNDADSHSSLSTYQAILEQGVNFHKYDQKGKRGPTIRHVFYKPPGSRMQRRSSSLRLISMMETGAGTIYWTATNAVSHDKVAASRAIPVTSITDLYLGKQTTAFEGRGSIGARTERCFSIICKKRTLDLEASSEDERRIWTQGIVYVAQYYAGITIKIHPDPTQTQISTSTTTTSHTSSSPTVGLPPRSPSLSATNFHSSLTSSFSSSSITSLASSPPVLSTLPTNTSPTPPAVATPTTNPVPVTAPTSTVPRHLRPSIPSLVIETPSSSLPSSETATPRSRAETPVATTHPTITPTLRNPFTFSSTNPNTPHREELPVVHDTTITPAPSTPPSLSTVSTSHPDDIEPIITTAADKLSLTHAFLQTFDRANSAPNFFYDRYRHEDEEKNTGGQTPTMTRALTVSSGGPPATANVTLAGSVHSPKNVQVSVPTVTVSNPPTPSHARIPNTFTYAPITRQQTVPTPSSVAGLPPTSPSSSQYVRQHGQTRIPPSSSRLHTRRASLPLMTSMRTAAFNAAAATRTPPRIHATFQHKSSSGSPRSYQFIHRFSTASTTREHTPPSDTSQELIDDGELRYHGTNASPRHSHTIPSTSTSASTSSSSPYPQLSIGEWRDFSIGISASHLFPHVSTQDGLEFLVELTYVDGGKQTMEYVDRTERLGDTRSPCFSQSLTVREIRGASNMYILSVYDVYNSYVRDENRIGWCFFNVDTLLEGIPIRCPLTHTSRSILQQLQVQHSCLVVRVINVGDIQNDPPPPVTVTTRPTRSRSSSRSNSKQSSPLMSHRSLLRVKSASTSHIPIHTVDPAMARLLNSVHPSLLPSSHHSSPNHIMRSTTVPITKHETSHDTDVPSFHVHISPESNDSDMSFTVHADTS